MPRYFFDIEKNTQTQRDEVGTICGDDESALRHAWSALSMLTGEADRRLAWQHIEICIRSEDGLNVGCLGITISLETINPVAKAMLNAKNAAKPLFD